MVREGVEGRSATQAPQGDEVDLFVVRVENTETRSNAEYTFARSPVRFGRNSRNDLSIASPVVSAWHGLIEFDAIEALYTDLGSTNGSILNGSDLLPHQPAVIGPGDEVAIGPFRLTFALRGPPPPPDGAGVPPEPAPPSEEAGEPGPVRPGRITVLMQQLAHGPAEEPDHDWRDVLFPGATIGRFELVREVGRGEFGIVFEAKDRQLGRLVAFKAVRPGRHSQVMYRQERLQREAEAVAQLAHPNIVSLYDAGTCKSGPYLIFELLRGETLQARMRRGRLPFPEALEVAIQVAFALDHAHAATLVHRDLKPANVFLCTGGRVKVLDFGISHVLGARDARAVGTPAYMAPEQWRDGPQDSRTDVYGAAAMLYETLSGQLPYRVTADWSGVLEPGAKPQVNALDAPPALRELLVAALAAEPDRRPADGHAWLGALLAIQRDFDNTQLVELLLDKDEELRHGRAVESGGGRARLGKRAALAGVAAALLAALALAAWLALR